MSHKVKNHMFQIKNNKNALIFTASLALILILPFQFQVVKLGLLLLFVVVRMSKGGYVSRSYKTWSLVYIIWSLLPILFGCLYGNPAVNDYFAVYALWPSLFFIVFSYLKYDDFDIINKVMVLSYCIVVGVGLIAFFDFNLFMVSSGELLAYKASVREGFPFMAISGPGVTTGMYLYSYVLTYAIFSRKKSLFIPILLGIVFIFATSRRVIFVEVGLLVVFSLILISYFNRKHLNISGLNTKKLLLLVAGAVLLFIFIIDYYSLFELDDILLFIDNMSNTSDAERDEQAEKLIQAWWDKPLFGWGAGINAPGSVRSSTPGTYETGYHAMLFRSGIIGMLVFLVLIYRQHSLIIKSCKKAPEIISYGIPLLIASDMLLLADATNPYSTAFDYSWCKFIPLAFLNSVIIKHRYYK